MGDVINLNQYRKEQKRDLEKRKSAENRAKFVRSKSEKQSDSREARHQRRALDAKRLDDPAESE